MINPSNVSDDYLKKLNLYMRFGVKECWVEKELKINSSLSYFFVSVSEILIIILQHSLSFVNFLYYQ